MPFLSSVPCVFICRDFSLSTFDMQNEVQTSHQTLDLFFETGPMYNLVLKRVKTLTIWLLISATRSWEISLRPETGPNWR